MQQEQQNFHGRSFKKNIQQWENCIEAQHTQIFETKKYEVIKSVSQNCLPDYQHDSRHGQTSTVFNLGNGEKKSGIITEDNICPSRKPKPARNIKYKHPIMIREL